MVEVLIPRPAVPTFTNSLRIKLQPSRSYGGQAPFSKGEVEESWIKEGAYCKKNDRLGEVVVLDYGKF